MQIFVILYEELLVHEIIWTAIGLDEHLHIDWSFHQIRVLDLFFRLLLQLICKLANEAPKSGEFCLDKLSLIRIFFLQFPHERNEGLIKVVYTIIELIKGCLVITLCLD